MSDTPRTDAAAVSGDRLASSNEVVIANFSRTLERELNNTRANIPLRDGNWMDKWGSCKVCGGEIPDGHTENCDIWKLEQEKERLEQERDAARFELRTMKESK